MLQIILISSEWSTKVIVLQSKLSSWLHLKTRVTLISQKILPLAYKEIGGFTQKEPPVLNKQWKIQYKNDKMHDDIVFFWLKLVRKLKRATLIFKRYNLCWTLQNLRGRPIPLDLLEWSMFEEHQEQKHELVLLSRFTLPFANAYSYSTLINTSEQQSKKSKGQVI